MELLFDLSDCETLAGFDMSDDEDPLSIGNLSDFSENTGDICDLSDLGENIGDICNLSDLDENIGDICDVPNDSVKVNEKSTKPSCSPERYSVFYKFYSNLEGSLFTELVWDSFIFMCEKHIPQTLSTEHFRFLNMTAACLYCVFIKEAVPITIYEIIEVDKRITRDRMMKIGKSIFIDEKCQGELPMKMSVNLISRLAYLQKIALPPRDSIELLISRVKKEFVGIDYNRRLTMVFLRFTPQIAQTSITDRYFRDCCDFFFIPRCTWFFETCKKFQTILLNTPQ